MICYKYFLLHFYLPFGFAYGTFCHRVVFNHFYVIELKFFLLHVDRIKVRKPFPTQMQNNFLFSFSTCIVSYFIFRSDTFGVYSCD